MLTDKTKAAADDSMLTAHAAAPTQLPTHMSAVNTPYSRHTSLRPSSSSRHHRVNMYPLATALKQNAPICTKK